MKRKVLIGTLLWTLLITLLHVHINVGWRALWHDIKVARGEAREELLVGFLPVT